MARRLIVLGVQWGDEGKGKIVDLLTENTAAVVRFQGGNNAGHTLIVDGHKTILRLIPSGIIRQQVTCMLGHGVVVSPEALLTEMAELAYLNINWQQRLLISNSCSLILPFHIALDEAREKQRTKAIGTTKRGIGPAYEDRISRRGLRMVDLLYPQQLKQKLAKLAKYHNFMLTEYYQAEAIDVDVVYNQLIKQAEQLTPLLGDVHLALKKLMQQGKKIMLEGAQGSLLDIDMGTYPFVTSSNTTIGAAYSGTGLAPQADDYVLGVCKAYATRVGGGPFPSEDHGEMGALLAKNGHEFGSVTQRPRRCGWLDLVALDYTLSINGITALAITKLDVLDELAEIKICTGYLYKGQVLKSMPQDAQILNECEAVYETFAGWQCSTEGCTSYSQLPIAAQKYLQAISSATTTPLAIVSTGPDRAQTMIITDPTAELAV